MNYLLYGHGGSNNHGCEAIVRTVVENIESFNGQSQIKLSTIDVEADKQWKLPITDYIVNKFCFEPTIFDRVICRLSSVLFHDDNYFNRKNYKVLLRTITHLEKDTICFSIGGDNYCCPNPSWLYEINDKLDKRGLKRVLWGCSIEPDFINTKMIDDLNGYKLIVARESITYNALLKHGIKENVYLAPDPAFLLKTSKDELNIDIQKEFIGINLSPVIIGAETTNGIVFKNYLNMMHYILQNTKYSILLIPHVSIGKNCDYVAMQQLVEEIGCNKRIVIVNNNNCMNLKQYISRCRMFIGARTHSTIAAYSSLVPTLVVGYSVKSKGIAKDIFGTYDNFVISAQDMKNEDDLTRAFIWLVNNEIQVRKHLHEFLPNYIEQVKKKNNQCFEILLKNGF